MKFQIRCQLYATLPLLSSIINLVGPCIEGYGCTMQLHLLALPNDLKCVSFIVFVGR